MISELKRWQEFVVKEMTLEHLYSNSKGQITSFLKTESSIILLLSSLVIWNNSDKLLRMVLSQLYINSYVLLKYKLFYIQYTTIKYFCIFFIMNLRKNWFF